MSFAASWYRASCALLLLTLYFSMFSFYPPFLLSLSLPLFLSLSLSPSPSVSLSVSLSLSLALSMSLCGCKTRVIWYPLPNILFLINLTFHTLSLHSSNKIHQPFTDYFLRLPYSELLEKRLFRSRANRRLVSNTAPVLPCNWTWIRMLRIYMPWEWSAKGISCWDETNSTESFDQWQS